MTKEASKSGSLLKMIIQPFDIFLFSIYFILLFLSIFWIMVLFTVKDGKKPALRNDLPMFTAIVPAYNEEKTIRKTIESLVALDYPKEKINVIKEDFSDNIFLETAIAGNVDFIITGNNHLLKLKEFKGIRIISPKEFLEI